MPDATGSVTSSPVVGRFGNSIAATGGNQQGFDKDTFLKLLVAQLKYQSPDSPVDTNQFMQQTATMTQTEAMQNMLKAQQNAVLADQSVLGTSMIGKAITATNPLGGADIIGTVTSVKLGTDGPVLKVGDTEVDLKNVKEVTTPKTA